MLALNTSSRPMERRMLRLLPPLLATAWVVAARFSNPSPPLSRPPNFVVIFLDDAGWGDAGFNVGPIETPETKVLDQLATEGLRFTDFHAAASVCTPSRASLLTGRLGLRTGVTTNFREGALGGLPQTEVTLAELLRDQAGYHTAMLGKWHLGTHPPYHPSYRGFDRYLGVPYSVDMGCTNVVGEDHPPRLPCCKGAWTTGPSPVPSPDPEHPRRHFEIDTVAATQSLSIPFFAQRPPTAAGPICVEAPAVPLYNSTGPECSSKPSCNQDIIEQPVNLTSLARRYGEFAEAFVEEQAKKHGTTRTPFFLYIAMSHMHVPLAYDPRFDNASSRTDRRVYGNALAEVDFEVGRIIEVLHRTNLANDTLVFITSDNGPWDMKCHLAGLTGPYEGQYMMNHHGTGTGKFTTWEGGHRVPALAYWPSRIVPGSVTSALTSTLDIFPTFATLAGATLPTDRGFDGLDLTMLLLQDSEQRSNDTIKGHETLFHPDQFGQLSAMRLGKYKIHFRLTQAPPCVPGDKRNMDDILEQWTFVLGDGDETKGWLDVPLVFDLEADPHEAHPLSVSREDADMLHDLWQHKMDDIRNDFNSTPDYLQRDDPTGWPCCDVESPACFCPWQRTMI